MVDFDNIPDEDFLIARGVVSSSLKNLYPDFDFGRGSAFDDLIISPQAKLRVLTDLNQQDYYKSFTLEGLTESDSDSLIDLILSRYFVKRVPGGKARGIIQLVFNKTSTINIRRGAVFTVGNLEFTAEISKRVFSSENLVSAAGDDFFRPISENLWYVNLPVIAAEEGERYNIPGRTSLTSRISFSGLVSIRALTTFSGGTNRESNAQLLARLPMKYSAVTSGSAEGIISLVREAYPPLEVSVVGKGNSALIRDSRNPLGLSSGGFTDVYIRPGIQAPIEEAILEAEVISPVTNEMQLTLRAEEYPGLQQIISISHPDKEQDLEITNIEAFPSPPQFNYESSLRTPIDSYGSHRHNIRVRFRDNVRNTSSLNIGDLKTYRVRLLGSSTVKDVQSLLSSPQHLNPGTNILVKLGIPVLTSFSIKIKRFKGDPYVNKESVRSSVLDALSTYGINTSELDSSIVKHAVNATLGTKSFLDTDRFSMVGTVYLPDNSSYTVSSKEKLVVQDNTSLGVTRDTVVFYTGLGSISVEIEDIQ